MRVEGSRMSLRGPVLVAALASGLALSASGCFIESSGPSCTPHGTSDPSCVPDLTISWRLISTVTNAVLTCAEAGNADTVTAWIDGGGYCGELTAFDSECLANATQGSFVARLPAPGTYNVSLQILTGGPTGTVLSDSNILVQPVGCAGAATPQADMLVNF